MRVALDVTPAIVGMSGLRHYANVTWDHLVDHGVEVSAFAAGRGPRIDGDVRRLPVPLRLLQASWRLTHWPTAETLAGKVDVVHSLDLLPPPTRRPLVVTVMDVLAITHPQYFTERVRQAQQQHLDGAARAQVVVCGCTATAEEIARVSTIPRERIVVTPYGRLPGPVPPAHPPDRPPTDPYLLSVSTIEPRKGYIVLAEAIARVPDCPRVLVAGPDGYLGEQIRRRVKEIDRHDRITFLGDVRDPVALGRLYSEATLVVQATLAEGFGFPVLEAMGRGCAVVASDIPQAREIGADAVEFVPVGDAEALAATVSALLGDEGRRAALGGAAAARAAGMTWDVTTEHLVGAYQRALG
jgi:glycosyltransferase involved in cell wall biosynthesis